MRKKEKKMLALAAVLLSAAYAFYPRRGGPGSCEFGLSYVERITGGANAADTLPLVVYLHPRGAKSAGFTSFANRIKTPARVLFPSGPHVRNGRHSWTTTGSKGDQEVLAAQMRESGAALLKFIDAAQRCLPTAGKPVITGQSQGGNMAYYMSSQFPGLVKGAVAVAGWLPRSLWNSDMAPTFGGHGEYDTTTPYARTQDFWDQMRGAGADLGTRTFPVGHTTSGMGSWWGARVTELIG